MTWLAALVISGLLPAALPAPERILWLNDGGAENPAGCTFQGANTWTCDGLPADPHGLIVIVDASTRLAYIPVGLRDDVSGGIADWGRILQVVPGGAAIEDVHHIQVAALRPERPAHRLSNQRFTTMEDASVHILSLSESVFWVAGEPTDPDAFVQVDGPAIATTRIFISALKEGPPEWPVVHAADTPFTLTGRVETSQGDDVEGVVVELFEPLRPLRARTGSRIPEALIRRAISVSQADGTFTFDRLEPGPYHISVVHPALGRGDTDVRSVTQPVDVRLVPTTVAKGRVLRSSLPVPDARVRFVPDVNALVASSNAEDHVGEDTVTTADGRFSLALPPDTTGAVQVIGTDNASVRIPLVKQAPHRDISLGDIALPEPRRVELRATGADGCALAAVGPLGHLGLSIVQAVEAGVSRRLDLPEGGDWALTAQCEGTNRDVTPRILSVPDRGPASVVDATVIAPPIQ